MTLTTPSPRLRTRPALPPGAVADLATALLATRPIWHGVARFDPDGRRPVRLLADDLFEAWVIGWLPGQELGLHDHGDSVGAIAVADGRLHETTLGPPPDERVPHARVLTRGHVRTIPTHTVHGVANRDPVRAVSLHVYSPPLDRMTHFDAAHHQPVTTVAVAPEPPLLPAAVGQLLRIAHRI